MKKFIQALFIIFCAIAVGIVVYYFIQTRSAAAEANRPLALRKLVVNPDATAHEAASAQAEREAAMNKIAALPNELILDAISINLDPDEGDEQILTVRKTDNSGDRLSIVVADFIPQRKGWVRAWEGETLATKLTTFQIQTDDFIGDHNLDIICTGMDDANDQTMTVFRRVSGPDETVIYYSPIFAQTADSFDVQRLERTEGYQLGQTNGSSWLIEAYRRDKDSENLLDQVKTLYAWDQKSKAYQESGSEKIPGAQVEKEMASKVLTGKEADFESFLHGAWCESGKSPFDADARILVFDRAANSIVFYSVDDQEDFDWNESHSTNYGLYVGCQNESVSDLRRLMDIELTGADRISVRIFEDLQMKVDAQMRWDGSYQRLPAETAASALREQRQNPSVKLEGSYRGANGLSLQFEGQRFSLQSGEILKKGGFIVYKLGDEWVLQLSVLQDSGLIAERETFRLRYSESRSGKGIIRHIQLSPARAMIDGLELLQEPELSLDQRSAG